MSIIAAGTTTTTALSSTGNTDGTLQLRVNGTTPSVTLNTLGAIGVGAIPNYGTSGQALVSAGSTAAPTWASVTTNPAGSTGQVQYNNAGVFGAISSGTTGQVLTSAGSGAAPTWSSPASPFQIGDVMYSTQAPDSNWLQCNGATYLQSSYTSLYSKLGLLGTPYAGTWTTYSNLRQFSGIFYVGGTYYTMSDNFSTSGLFSTTNLASGWTRVTTGSLTLSALKYGIYNGSRFFSTDGYQVFYTSTTPYTSVTAANTGNCDRIYGFEWNGSSTYVVVGTNSGAGGGRIAYSSNGTTWSNATTGQEGNSSVVFGEGLSYGGGNFVTYLNGGASNVASIYYSSDGVTWNNTTFTISGNITAVSFANGFHWVSASGNQLWKSANGTSWSQVTYTSSPDTNIFANGQVLIGDGTILMRGWTNGYYYASLNGGVTWYRVQMGTNGTGWSTSFQPGGRSYANSLFFSMQTLSGPSYAWLYSSGYAYNPATQFVVPSFSSPAGAYAAPVNAYIKAL